MLAGARRYITKSNCFELATELHLRREKERAHKRWRLITRLDGFPLVVLCSVSYTHILVPKLHHILPLTHLKRSQVE